ncbi:hypothetical protein [Sphingobacterium mizutaii]|uniref:hypothetical protein n=1 Tax=Sphingobacterium mizutaii TaxID=1010 RepID=UPI00289F1134|nr:hypothetical protein [Sphingobacterium mizutaii]
MEIPKVYTDLVSNGYHIEISKGSLPNRKTHTEYAIVKDIAEGEKSINMYLNFKAYQILKDVFEVKINEKQVCWLNNPDSIFSDNSQPFVTYFN